MKMIILFGVAIVVIATLIHTINITMLSPKILVFKEGGYECVTLRGSGGASCYKLDHQNKSGN